jgi:hypothetical protein
MIGSAQVVHLVRDANGIEPFADFLDSYRRHPAGIEHELVLLFKGFRPERDASPYLERAAGLGARALYVEDRGLDLTAYRWALENLDAPHVCFLNSFSRIQCADWLARLAGPLAEQSVGMTGASGTFESMLSSAPRWLKPLRRRSFPPFPNPHLRSNAFMLAGPLALALGWRPPRHKREAWALESGKRSLTRQVLERGLAVLVMGCDGIAYPPERWRESATFRAGAQRNLLVADKRTEQYAEADPEFKRQLERMAWGSPESSPLAAPS